MAFAPARRLDPDIVPVNQVELQRVTAQLQERRIHLDSFKGAIPETVWNRTDALLKAAETACQKKDTATAKEKMGEFDRVFGKQLHTASNRMFLEGFETLIYPKSMARLQVLLDEAFRSTGKGDLSAADRNLTEFGTQLKRWTEVLSVEQKADELWKKGKMKEEDYQFIKQTAQQAKQNLENEEYPEAERLTEQLQKRWEPYEKVWQAIRATGP